MPGLLRCGLGPRWGTFSSGKNNSLRSDIFSRQKRYPTPDLSEF